MHVITTCLYTDYDQIYYNRVGSMSRLLLTVWLIINFFYARIRVIIRYVQTCRSFVLEFVINLTAKMRAAGGTKPPPLPAGPFGVWRTPVKVFWDGGAVLRYLKYTICFKDRKTSRATVVAEHF